MPVDIDLVSANTLPIDVHGATTPVRPERWNDAEYYLDPLSDPEDKVHIKEYRGNSELLETQAAYLVSEHVRTHTRQYTVSRAELKSFSTDPTSTVTLRAM